LRHCNIASREISKHAGSEEGSPWNSKVWKRLVGIHAIAATRQQ